MREKLSPRLAPLHVEVEAEGDAVVLVVDLEHVRDLDAWGSGKNYFLILRNLVMALLSAISWVPLVFEKNPSHI